MVESYEPLGTGWSETPIRALRKHGFYAITGGLGELGLALGERLASELEARLLLLTRRPRCEPGLLQRIRSMEEAGAQVMVASVDITDATALRSTFAEAEARFGMLRGVFHLAGDLNHRSFRREVLEIETSDLEAQLHPKVQGFRTLSKVLADRSLDFGIVFSSIAAFLGGIGFGAYGAANAMLDSAVVTASTAGPSAWMSIDWDAWTSGAQSHPHSQSVTEGLDALWHVIRFCTVPRIAISSTPLAPRIETWVYQSGTRRPVSSQPSVAPSESASLLASRARRTTHTHVAPRTELERNIARVWEDVLGTDDLGVDDHFLDLGGDSLIALRIITRTKDLYGVSLHLPALIGPPGTLSGFTQEVVAALAANHEGMEEKLAELE